MIKEKIIFLVQPIECWKAPFWETNISGHDMQHTQIATDNFCSQVTVKQSTVFF